MNKFGSTLYVYNSPSFVRIAKCTTVRWAVHVARVELRKAISILVLRSFENRPLLTKKEMGRI
jgi:hypothetical protein